MEEDNCIRCANTYHKCEGCGDYVCPEHYKENHIGHVDLAESTKKNIMKVLIYSNVDQTVIATFSKWLQGEISGGEFTKELEQHNKEFQEEAEDRADHIRNYA